MNMDNITERIRKILMMKPEARDNDNLLYYLVCAKELQDIGLSADTVSFADVFLHLEKMPPYETVSRLRRLVQRTLPELQGSRRISRKRNYFQDVIKEYVTEGND